MVTMDNMVTINTMDTIIENTNILEKLNSHPRDRYIQFYEEDHRYTIHGIQQRKQVQKCINVLNCTLIIYKQ